MADFLSSWFAPMIGLACLALLLALLLRLLMRKPEKLPGKKQLADAVRQLEHEVAGRRAVEESLRQSQATLRDLAAHLENIREDERKRVAREIHDELGQNLLAIRLEVATLHARTGAAQPRLHKRAQATLHHIDATMKSIRSIMNNLRPSVLDLGLQAAIEWQVDEFRRYSGIACELVTDGHESALDDAQATTIFRVLQESLANIRRHARATSVRVELSVNERRVSMAVKDNGIGMYPNARRKARRFGLVGMKERITMLNGELRIDSIPGQGTALWLSIPLQPQVRATQLEVD